MTNSEFSIKNDAETDSWPETFDHLSDEMRIAV